MTSASAFRTQLESAVNARHSRINPFTEKWVNGELTRAQLGAWACQHYQYVSQFARWCAAVYGNCPDVDARDFLLENIIEEEVGHQARRPPHPLRRGLRGEPRRGRARPAAARPRARSPPGATRCLEAAASIAAAAGLLVGLESQVPGIYKRNLPPLKHALRLHRSRGGVLRDPHRGRRGAWRARLSRSSSATARRPRSQAEAVEPVRQATEMRWQYMSGLHRAFVPQRRRSAVTEHRSRFPRRHADRRAGFRGGRR